MTPRPSLGRTNARVEVQRTLTLALIGGSLAFVALLLAVVWAVAVPHGPYAPRRIAPLLDDLARRAAAGDAIGVHGLYSRSGLRATTLDAVDDLLASDAFVGARAIAIDRIVPIDGLDALAPRAAIVNGRIRYDAGRPSRPVALTLDLEDGVWLVRSIDLSVEAEP